MRFKCQRLESTLKRELEAAEPKECFESTKNKRERDALYVSAASTKQLGTAGMAESAGVQREDILSVIEKIEPQGANFVQDSV